MKVKVDKNKNIQLGTFLASFGFTEKHIRKLFGKNALLDETLKKDKILEKNHQDKDDLVNEAQEDIFRSIRKGDRDTVDAKKSLLPGMLFDRRRYNLSETGRYMLNNKLSLVDRITNTFLAQDIKNKSNEVIFEKGTFIDFELAKKIQESYNLGLVATEKLEDIDPEHVYYKLYRADLTQNNPQNLFNNPDLRKRIKVIRVKVYPNKKW
ncbi:DNA-directed RNA polymerase subunit beta, partial [Mycoplasmopsis edwardii]